MRPSSIRVRMTVGFAIFITLLMAFVCLAFYTYSFQADKHAVDGALSQAIHELGHELESGDKNPKLAIKRIREEYNELRVRDLAMLAIDAKGQVVATSAGSRLSWPPRYDEWRMTTYDFAGYKIVLALPWEKTERRLRERILLLLALSTFVIAFSAVGAWFLVGRTLAPIDGLALQAQSASVDSLRVRLGAPSPDVEIMRLVNTLNGLLARLEQTAAERGRFYAAASHELRTPIQALSGHLEVARSRKRSAAEYELVLAEAHSQTERLTVLVQDLLLLNKLDVETRGPVAETLDVADICAAEISPLLSLATERGLTISPTLPDISELVAPWSYAEMVVRNLLQNAVKYASPGGTVKVELRDNILTVSNDCEWTGEWDSEKLFEPFYRPDASRNGETGGNGLGLAICKAICNSEGWAISLERHNKTFSATIDFNASRQ